MQPTHKQTSSPTICDSKRTCVQNCQTLSTAHRLLSLRRNHPIITTDAFWKFSKTCPNNMRSMFPYSCPTFSYQYRQKILLTRQLAGTIKQLVKSPKSGLYGQRQTSRHPKAPKQPEFIIEILFAEAKVLSDNDPSAGAPTKTLLRIYFL